MFSADDICDRVIHADNLTVLNELPDECLDLVYIDPPFNTGAVQRLDRIVADADSESRRLGAGGVVRGFRITGSQEYRDDMPREEYLGWLHEILTQIQRVLKPQGSLYLHLDWRMTHYARFLLDDIFGEDKFRNEIIWSYDYGGRARNKWAAKHDTILWYSKSDEWIFNRDEIDRLPYLAPGLVGPVKAALGKLPTDVWQMTIVPTGSLDRTGWPTQKPVALVERIIRASCPPGGLVADFFAGSGTTGIAARKAGRHYLLVDKDKAAIEIIERRLARAAQGLAYHDSKSGGRAKKTASNALESVDTPSD